MTHESQKQTQRESQNKPRLLPGILLGAGLAAAVSALLLFTVFLPRKNRDAPRITDARQIGATHSSVLLSWQNTSGADGYRITYSAGGTNRTTVDSDIPFAVLRNLPADSDFEAEILATANGREGQAVTVHCRTESYCEVTAIAVSDNRDGSASLSWDYSGTNEGFSVVAYVLDEKGFRHLTTSPVTVNRGEPAECTVEGLYPGLCYTAAVMPLNRYHKLCQSTFQTGFYSDSYNRVIFSRFVICSPDSQNTPVVRSLQIIQPSSPYKASLMFSGKTDSSHTIPVSLLLVRADGQLCGAYRFPAFATNPEDKPPYTQRFALLDFTSPKEEGDYTLVLLADGHWIQQTKFTVRRDA